MCMKTISNIVRINGSITFSARKIDRDSYIPEWCWESLQEDDEHVQKGNQQNSQDWNVINRSTYFKKYLKKENII